MCHAPGTPTQLHAGGLAHELSSTYGSAKDDGRECNHHDPLFLLILSTDIYWDASTDVAAQKANPWGLWQLVNSTGRAPWRAKLGRSATGRWCLTAIPDLVHLGPCTICLDIACFFLQASQEQLQKFQITLWQMSTLFADQPCCNSSA